MIQREIRLRPRDEATKQRPVQLRPANLEKARIGAGAVQRAGDAQPVLAGRARQPGYVDEGENSHAATLGQAGHRHRWDDSMISIDLIYDHVILAQEAEHE